MLGTGLEYSRGSISRVYVWDFQNFAVTQKKIFTGICTLLLIKKILNLLNLNLLKNLIKKTK